MSRKTTKRKHYALTNVIALAIEGATITPEDKLDQLRMLELSAVESFATGKATQSDWRAIADMCNLCQTMVGMGIGPEALETAQAVEVVLQEAHQRFVATGRIGTTGLGLRKLRNLYNVHDQQRKLVDRSTYEKAIVRTRNKIHSAHPSLKVMA